MVWPLFSCFFGEQFQFSSLHPKTSLYLFCNLLQLHAVVLVLIPSPRSHPTHIFLSIACQPPPLFLFPKELLEKLPVFSTGLVSSSLAFRWSSFFFWAPAWWYLDLWNNLVTRRPVAQMKWIHCCLQMYLPAAFVQHHTGLCSSETESLGNFTC